MYRFRHRRAVIGVIASLALLLDLFGVAMLGLQGNPSAAAGTIETLIAQSLCTPDGRSALPGVPADPWHHDQPCSLCGVACPMGGGAPVGSFPARPALVEHAPVVVARVVFRQAPAIPSGFALYPSDVVSQAPPHAA